MNALHVETINRNGIEYRISIHHDEDASNPLEDLSEMGSILSLNRRHVNYDPSGVEDAAENNPDAVPLSYYEHGNCLWTVAGQLPTMARCRWDSVDFAGVWIPDADTLESARNLGGFTRRAFMRKRAGQACEVYSQWANGEIYGYRVERIAECPHCGQEESNDIGSCWGFYGFDECRAEAIGEIPDAKDVA
jgi:hypothetical protein